MRASKLGKIRIMKTLLDHGADVKKRNNSKETVLHIAAYEGKKDCLKYICEYYSDMIMLKDTYGNTALHTAAYLGNLQCIKLLLKHGADPNVTNSNGRTPLSVARYYKNKECVDELLKW